MKITENDLNIKHIADVTQGTILRENIHCEQRLYDGFVYVLSGKAEYRFKDKAFTARHGDVFYLAAESSYDICIKEHEYNFIYADFLFDGTRSRESDIYGGTAISGLQSDFFKLLKLWSFGNFSDKIRCKSLIYEIYAVLVRESAFEYVPEIRKNQLRGAMSYFEQNYANPELTVAELAEVCNLSEGHFRRIFLKVFHMPPIKYINAYRLNIARQMLVSTDLSVSEISLRCGFNSVYYFDRVFMREWGIQPGKYRNGYTKNQR